MSINRDWAHSVGKNQGLDAQRQEERTGVFSGPLPKRFDSWDMFLSNKSS